MTKQSHEVQKAVGLPRPSGSRNDDAVRNFVIFRKFVRIYCNLCLR